jgi:type VI secretion system protein ImpC
MAGKQEDKAKLAPSAEPLAEISPLEGIINATKEKPDEARKLVQTLVERALEGTVVWDRNVSRTFQKAIDLLDSKLSKQLAAVMHHPEFAQLEGTWRGFKHLVFNSETSAMLKIRVLNASKRELAKDLEKAVEFDQSQLFKKLYEHEYGTPGGEPYGALIGDYYFSGHPEDIDMLNKLSGVAAASFCPFIAGTAPQMFGFQNFTELSRPRDLEKIFQTPNYTGWRSFRDSEDSRFVTLTMPRVLARVPFGSFTKKIEEFNFEEVEMDDRGRPRALDHGAYCWMNASFVMGAKLTESFAKYGWCTTIRGRESGGTVESLPTHVFYCDDGDMDAKCPAEIAITDRRERELSELGFLPLCHYKNTDYAVFFGGQTVQKPKKYDVPSATANARLSAGLPYIMAASRIAHYLKVIARDKVGSKMERGDVEDFLKRWLSEYVCLDAKPTAEIKAKYPLAEAKVEVREIPGKPGCYDAVAWLRPWLFFEELNASLRLVASVPQAKG